jgi:transcription elongation factor Elf1
MEHAYLDASILKCPYCGKLYVDASWYTLDMESDLECGVCGGSFNSHRNLIKRVLLKFSIYDEDLEVEVEKFIE